MAGNENTDEWMELYNYGTASVNLAGWTIRDSSGNNATLPAITVPSDQFVILAADAAAFQAAWGVGTVGANVSTVSWGRR